MVSGVCLVPTGEGNEGFDFREREETKKTKEENSSELKDHI